MLSMEVDVSWTDDRARLNHDILANQLQNEVMMLQDDPQGACVRLVQWIGRENEFRCFLAESLKVLSFSRLMDLPIFDVWNSKRRQLIRSVADELFLRASTGPAAVEELESILSRTLELAREFVATPGKKRTEEQVKTLLDLIGRLSRGISMLPRDRLDEAYD